MNWQLVPKGNDFRWRRPQGNRAILFTKICYERIEKLARADRVEISRLGLARGMAIVNELANQVQSLAIAKMARSLPSLFETFRARDSSP